MLSVVIPTLDRPDPVRDAVTDALAQLPAGGELVVVDQSAEPSATADFVAGLGDPRARHLRLRTRSLPNARNAGIEATSRPIVLFLDDDVRLEPGCLAGHAAAYGEPRVGGVVGRIAERRVRPNSRRTANRVGPGGRVITNLSGDRPRRIETLKGANMSLRRAALAQVGGFDRSYGGTAFLEDADLSTRVAAAGWELWFRPEAALVHLSAPAGGVRVGGARDTERWRFHNTGYFARRHGLRRARVLATFSAVAARRALAWRDPGAVGFLLDALMQGWALAAGPPATEGVLP